MDRKTFIKSLIGSSALATSYWDISNVNELIESTAKPIDGSMIDFAANPIQKVRIGIIGLGNRGNTLTQMLEYMVQEGMAEIVAICDLKEEKCNQLEDQIKKWQKRAVQKYYGDETEWKKLAERDDVDLILITTPWEWHAPMSIYGMEKGKHVACEVPIAYTLEDCWNIIEASERTRKHCIMLENCCYNEEELFVLNMIQEGVFGDITHTEGAYLHDLRAHMLSEDYYEGQWRGKHHMKRDGNFYTTHGLGPISFYLDVGRGDTLDFLTSMSSRELNFSQAAPQGSPFKNIKCGDMNNTLIKTKKGKTILLQFDVHTGRPYSRINKVVGTKATHDGYPSRLYIDDGELVFWGHKWLEKDDYTSYRNEYMHPLISKLKKLSQSFKQGHGGMDFVMMYRLIRALNLGNPLDINVYDGVMWSAITPLSELSVANNSMPVMVPDFYSTKWKEKNKQHLMEV